MQRTRPAKGYYWFVYGIFEGPRHRRYLAAALEELGFKPARSAQEATILFAHSGGCFSLPKGLHNTDVFLCQPACGWKGSRIPLFLMLIKTLQDIWAHLQRRQIGRWLWKTGWNLTYMVLRPGYNWRIMRDAQVWRMELAPVDAERVTVVNSKLDPWSDQLPQTEIKRNPQRRYVSLPGAHDDIWTDPHQLADLVRSLYEA